MKTVRFLLICRELTLPYSNIFQRRTSCILRSWHAWQTYSSRALVARQRCCNCRLWSCSWHRGCGCSCRWKCWSDWGNRGGYSWTVRKASSEIMFIKKKKKLCSLIINVHANYIHASFRKNPQVSTTQEL